MRRVLACTLALFSTAATSAIGADRSLSARTAGHQRRTDDLAAPAPLRSGTLRSGLERLPERGSQGGALLWEDRYDPSPFEQAFSVATRKNQVFVAGFVWNPQGRDFLVRALDARTGDLEWQDQLDQGDDEFASGVATDEHRLFVSGTVFRPDTGYDWILRAYRAHTGEFLWENTFDLVGRSDFSRGTALAAGGGLVFLGGYATNAADVGDFNTDWIVRAHDAASGELVWQDRIEGRAGAYTLSFEGGRLFAGGWHDSEQSENAIVRAYDAATGQRLWERSTPGTLGVGGTWTKIIRGGGGRVFAAQSVVVGDPGRFVPRVKAFSAATGHLLWDDTIDAGPDNGIEDLEVSGSRVTAVGYGGPRCTGDSVSDCDVLIRTYRASRGTLLWERQHDLSGLDDRANLVTTSAGTVFVQSSAGPLTFLQSCCVVGQWVVSAFDASTGGLRWQSLGGEGDSSVYNMAVDRGRLFIPGRVIDFDAGDWDLLVRAYDARGHHGEIEFPLRRQVALTGTSGQASYDVTFSGPVTTAPHGLVAAEEQAGTVADDPANDVWTALANQVGVTLHTVTVPAGARHLRVGLFNQETDGAHDLDLYLFRSGVGLVASSGSINSNEVVNLAAPEPGIYTVAVHGYETDGPVAHYTLFTWTLDDSAAGNLSVSGPVPATGGAVSLSWSGLTAGGRYLGAVSYADGASEIGQTLVAVHAVE